MTLITIILFAIMFEIGFLAGCLTISHFFLKPQREITEEAVMGWKETLGVLEELATKVNKSSALSPVHLEEVKK